MQFALVNNIRREAFLKGKGTCPVCGDDVIAKCGNRVMHHWAHASQLKCDPWWENETLWHRAWKNLFPPECREISHTAVDGEIHRADIKTSTGIYIEVQHSAISDVERESREKFYGNLVWIIDGSVFKQNFDILHLLPNPKSQIAQDLVWSKGTRKLKGAAQGMFFRLSENPGTSKNNLQWGQVHGISEIIDLVNETYSGHHQYDWIKPRKTWLEASCPVYIDFGDDFLARLMTYYESGLPCVYLVSKKKFLHGVSTETSAEHIATRFYTLPS